MRGLLLILALLALLGGAALFLFLREGEGPAFERGRIEEGTADEAANAARRAARESAEEDAGSGESGAGDRPGDDAPELAEPVAGGLLVRCVLKETGEPVPGAELLVEPDAVRGGPDWEWGIPVEEEFRRFGRPHRADSRGEVWLPPDEDLRRAIALAPGLLGGVASFRSGETDEVEIAMVPRRAVVVAVVGEDGAPRPGVEVTLRRAYGSRENISHFERKTTDGLGRAEIDLSATIAQGSTAGSEFLVGIDGTFREPIEKAIDPYVPPDEPIRFVLPPCGEVLVRTLPSAPEAGAGALLVGTDLRGRFRRKAFTGDRALFATVAVGLDLLVSYHPASSATDARQSRTLPGPRAEGETVAVDFDREAAPKRVVLTALVVDHEGRPLRRKSVTIRTFEDDDEVAHVAITSGRTDGAGGFALALNSDAVERLARFRWALVASPEQGRPEVRSFEARAFVPGEQDLGRVQLEELPVVVAGRVSDDAGTPLRGVQINVVLDQTDRGSGRARYWGPLHTRSDAGGRFEIRDRVDFSELTARCWREGHSSGEVDVPVGTRDVELRLLRRSRIVLVCASESGRRITGLALDRLRDGDPMKLQRSWVPEDGRLEIEIEAGLWDLRLVRASTWSDRAGERVADWPATEIRPGETRDLGRVVVPQRGIDVEVAIDVAEGLSPGHFQYRIFRTGSEEVIGNGFVRGDEGRLIRFDVAALPVDLEVVAEGAGCARKTILAERDHIAIGPGIRLGVRLVAKDSSLAGKFAYAHLFDDANHFNPGTGSVGGEVIWFVVPRPGRYRILMHVDGRSLPTRSKDGKIRLYEPEEFEVEAGGDPGIVTVTLHEEAAQHLR